MKKKIQAYLEVGDENIIKAVYTLLDAQVKATETNFEFTKKQKGELNSRWKSDLAGNSKIYTFSEIKQKFWTKKGNELRHYLSAKSIG